MSASRYREFSTHSDASTSGVTACFRIKRCCTTSPTCLAVSGSVDTTASRNHCPDSALYRNGIRSCLSSSGPRNNPLNPCPGWRKLQLYPPMSYGSRKENRLWRVPGMLSASSEMALPGRHTSCPRAKRCSLPCRSPLTPLPS